MNTKEKIQKLIELFESAPQFFASGYGWETPDGCVYKTYNVSNHDLSITVSNVISKNKHLFYKRYEISYCTLEQFLEASSPELKQFILYNLDLFL